MIIDDRYVDILNLRINIGENREIKTILDSMDLKRWYNMKLMSKFVIIVEKE